MMRAAITSVAVVGALLLCGWMYPNHGSRQHSYRRAESTFAEWAQS